MDRRVHRIQMRQIYVLKVNGYTKTFLRNCQEPVTTSDAADEKEPATSFAVIPYIPFGREVLPFAASLFLWPRGYFFCREVISFAVTVVGHSK